jgi:hypothetical protein
MQNHDSTTAEHRRRIIKQEAKLRKQQPTPTTILKAKALPLQA